MAKKTEETFDQLMTRLNAERIEICKLCDEIREKYDRRYPFGSSPQYDYTFQKMWEQGY